MLHQGLSYVPEIIRIELTSHFGIEKLLKTRCQERKLGLQSLPIPNHGLEGYQPDRLTRLENLLMDWETKLLYSTNWKDKSYNLILDVTDRLTKILRDEPMQMN